MKYKYSGFENPSVAKQRDSVPILLKVLRGEGHTVPVPVPKPRRVYKRKSAKNDMAEKRLEREIILRLRSLGYAVSKTGDSTTSYHGQFILPGAGDIQVFDHVNRRLVYLECKTSKGKQRATQVEFEKLCQSCGIKYAVVKSVTQAVLEVTT